MCIEIVQTVSTTHRLNLSSKYPSAVYSGLDTKGPSVSLTILLSVEHSQHTIGLLYQTGLIHLLAILCRR